MANPEHLKILKQGVEAWNRWRKENAASEVDLSNLEFSDYRERLTFSPSKYGPHPGEARDMHEAIHDGSALLDNGWSDGWDIDFSNINLAGANLELAQVKFTNLEKAYFQN